MAAPRSPRPTARRRAGARPDDDLSPAVMRTLASILSLRRGLSRGDTFDGKRNLDAALGYKATISPEDYRYRFERGGIAGPLVDVLPKACFRGGGELVENEDSSTVTPFESAWFALADEHAIWSTFLSADILAGLGRYAIVLIGSAGKLDVELKKLKAPKLLYLTPFSEGDAAIHDNDLVIDSEDPRFGQPNRYHLKRLTGPDQKERPVHHTRVIHVSDGLLDDRLYSQPRLERVWNRLDDLDKVTGGGSEAFWKRANQGLQLDLDKDAQISPEQKAELIEQLDEYEHKQRRFLRTKGMTLNTLGSDVADFSTAADAIITQIAGASRIPKRILLGSEMGQLASSQDRSNFRDQVQDRRDSICGPRIVRPAVDRFMEFGFLPLVDEYTVRWPTIQFLDEVERAAVASTWADINQKFGGEVVVTPDEIRDRLLDLPPLTEVQIAAGKPEPAAGGEPGDAEEEAVTTVVTPSAKRAAWRQLGRQPGELRGAAGRARIRAQRLVDLDKALHLAPRRTAYR